MKYKFTFSIIVPIYNVEKYVRRCIESLIVQTYPNIEIILVDDGATDSSGKICDEYANKDCRIKVVHKKNGGLSSARNAGIESATGQYILFVDGDDFLVENAIEILAEKLEDKISDVICFDIYQYRNGNIIGTLITKKFNDVAVTRRNILVNPSACARLYKTEFLKKNKIFFKEKIIYEDLALIPALTTYTKNIEFIDDKLYYYVMRDSSIMNNKAFNTNRDDKFIALETLENIFIQNKTYDMYKSEIEYLYIKHLLIMYSTEIFKFGKSIYKSRIIKALDCINEKFPDWSQNIYLKREPIYTKIYLVFLKYKLYFFLYLMNKVFIIKNRWRLK